MALSEYNGFSPEDRIKGDKIIKKAIDEGILPDLHTIPCALCGQDKGVREYHAEDYSPDKILDDVICVCKSCHIHIHSQWRGSKGWNKREEEIKKGIKHKPTYTTSWTPDDDVPIQK